MSFADSILHTASIARCASEAVTISNHAIFICLCNPNASGVTVSASPSVDHSPHEEPIVSHTCFEFERRPPGLQPLRPPGCVGIDDLDRDRAYIGRPRDSENGCIRGRIGTSGTLDFEMAEHLVSVTLDADVRGNCHLYTGHEAVELHVAHPRAHAGIGEIELDRPHACERLEVPGDNPFAFTFFSRPPGGYPLQRRDEILGKR